MFSVGTFFAAAREAAKNSNCIRRKVGAVMVCKGAIVATGWNGVGPDYPDCGNAGCIRCLEGGVTGSGYEKCICMHAEQSLIAHAAKSGLSTSGLSAYLTLRPCIQCLTLLVESGICEVIYQEHWEYDEEMEKIYQRIASHLKTFVRE